MNRRGMKDSPVASGCALLGLILLVLPHTSQGAVPDFTCYNVGLYAVDGNAHLIGGYKSGSDKGATVSFERVLDTGSGSELPNGLDGRDHNKVSAKLYDMPNSIGANRFGAYNCIFRSQDPVKITTIVLRENGDVSPASSTLTTSAGEDVTLTMTQLYNGPSNELRWKHNGNDDTAWNGKSSISIPNVQVDDAGIYECFIEGRYNLQNHALMKLLVRQCSPNKWGPSCDDNCPFCHNGGQCDDKTGDCICAPGFSGALCQAVHNNNCFGQDCGIRCTSNFDNACGGNLMCLPDPFGCTCTSGFTGPNCKQRCPDGMYGAGCDLECHCLNAACNSTVGTCNSGDNCRPGFTGDKCNECSVGRFGVNCAQECHCADGQSCDRGSGACPNDGLCEGEYRGENCQNSCPYGEIGPDSNCRMCYVPVSVVYEASSGQESSKTITWKAPQNKCPVIDYAVQYQLVKRVLCQEEDKEFKTLHNTTTRQSILPHPDSSLEAYSVYMVRVLARNEAGLGEFQENVYIEHTTPKKEPTGSPTNFRNTSTTKYSVALSWSEIPCGQRNGAINIYRLSYRVLEKPYDANFSPNNSFEIVDIDPLVMHHNISGLEPSTKYDFRLKGFNSVGVGEKTTLEAFTAVETDLPAPTRLSQTNISKLTSSTVTIALNLPSSSKYITGVQVGVEKVKTVTKRDTRGSRYQRSAAPTLDYIAAELSKTGLPATFTVGDGKTHGKNENKPLESNTQYNIYLGSVSRISESSFAVEWSEPLTVQVPTNPSGFLVVAVIVPILIVVIVVCAVIFWIKIRSNNSNRKASQSHQMKGSSSNAQAETSCGAEVNIVSGFPMSSQPSPMTSNQNTIPVSKKKAVGKYNARDENKGKPNKTPDKKQAQQDEYEQVGQYQPSAYETVGVGSVTTYDDIGLPTWAQPWSVLWVDMMLGGKVLGEGYFGEVRLGGVMQKGELSKAAIKTLKAHASVTDRQNFMTEFRAMTQVGHHPNVVQILGVCQHEDELYIALEYLPNGDLRSFLRKAREDDDVQTSLSPEKLLQFAVGVAKGMQHLAVSGVIHRDLAARNILLDDNLVAKVSDFGLSRGENIYVQKSKTRVPTRWLSLESLFNQTYTTKSDVWSFGILLWEIATFGGTPYSGIKTRGLATKLRNGYRMPKPDNCSDEIHKLMLKCWEKDPNNRPEFRTLVSMLTSIGESDIDHTYMTVPLKSENMTYENICGEFDDN